MNEATEEYLIVQIARTLAGERFNTLTLNSTPRDMTDERNEEPRYEGDGIVLNTRVERLEQEAKAANLREQSYKDATLKTNREIARFTGCLVLCSVVTAAIGIWQAHVASDAAKAAEEAVVQSRQNNTDAINAQKEIASEGLKSAQDNFAKALQSSDQSLKKTLTEMHAQTRAQWDSANSAKTQFQLDQRPYLFIDRITLSDINTNQDVTAPIMGEPLSVNISYKNIGKSAALRVIPRRHVMLGSRPQDFGVDPPEKTNVQGEVLVQGEEVTTSATTIRDTLNYHSIAINSSELVSWDGSSILLFGRIYYEDRFGNSYCLPILKTLIPTGAWYNPPTISVSRNGHLQKYSRADLCPKGTQP